MSSVVVHCPAKVNLGLKVLGKRPDGYHEIVTLFQAIDFWDEIVIDPRDDELSLSVDDPTIPSGEENLVLRAARLIRARLPVGRGAAFRLVKRIPVGGGLGGGSSDAAGALVGLNAAWKLGLADATLAAMAAELGSDVPFFLRGGTALGEGRGERLTPLAPLPTRALILGMPRAPLLTAEVYGALVAPLTPGNGGVTVSRFFGKLAERNDFALATNDLEAPAFSIRRELVAFRDALLEVGAEVALLSGSGSTVFGVFGPDANVASIVSTLRRAYPGWTLRETRTIASGVRVETAEGA